MSFTYKFLTTGNDSFIHDDPSQSLWVSGNAGNDTISVRDSGADTVDGGANSDLLTGDRSDVLIGGGGADTLMDGGRMLGGQGNDTFRLTLESGDGGLPARVVEYAGAGIDTILLDAGFATNIWLPDNIEHLVVEDIDRLAAKDDDGGLYIKANALDNDIMGSVLADMMEGGGGHDSLYGKKGNDLLSGDGGNDMLHGGEGADTLGGGAGNDTLVGQLEGPTAAADLMAGGIGDDWYQVGQGDIVVEQAGEGFDRVVTDLSTYTLADHVEGLRFDGFGPATLAGNAQANSIALNTWGGASSISGGAGADTITGRDGNDTLAGDNGFDRMQGGNGRDSMRGGDGFDRLEGENGNDTLDGQWGNDTLLGGEGDDQLRGGTANDNLVGGVGADTLWGQDGLDRMEGGGGSDLLRGGNGGDTMHGDVQTFDGSVHGGDQLLGEAGNDSLHGGGGNDTLTGGIGADTMDGGVGNDIFHYNVVSESGVAARDVIVGFEQGADLIGLNGIDADGTFGNRNYFGYVGDLPQGVAGQFWITYDDAGNSFILCDVQGDNVADMMIEVQGVRIDYNDVWA